MNKITKLTLNDTYPFGKYKGILLKHMLEEENPEFERAWRYLAWAKNTVKSIELQSDVIERMKCVFPKTSENDCYYSRYDHYNDIGSMVDISFQDVYGDFGY